MQYLKAFLKDSTIYVRPFGDHENYVGCQQANGYISWKAGMILFIYIQGVLDRRFT